MIAARSGRTDITNILLNGEHIDLDIQENVRIMYYLYVHIVNITLSVHNACMHTNLLHTCMYVYTNVRIMFKVCVYVCFPTEDWMVCSILLC